MRLDDSLQISLVEPTEHAIIIEFSDGTYAEFGVHELARIRPDRDRALERPALPMCPEF